MTDALLRMLIGLLLIAHGLVHLLYLTDDVPEFSFENSWIVPESARRTFGLALMAVTIVAFALLGLATWGVTGLAGVWVPLAITSSTLSILLLGIFWTRSVVLGMLIDVVIIVIAWAQPSWMDRIIT